MYVDGYGGLSESGLCVFCKLCPVCFLVVGDDVCMCVVNKQFELLKFVFDSVYVSVCFVCCVLDSVCELFGETIRNVFGCSCNFVVECYGCVNVCGVYIMLTCSMIRFLSHLLLGLCVCVVLVVLWLSLVCL